MFMPRPLSAAVDPVARRAIGKDWALYAALLDHWPEIVGTEYARLTAPVKIAFPPRQSEARRTGGVLTIRLPKGLAMEFSFRSEQIRQRVSAYFGYDAIARIAFEPVYYVPEAATSPKTEEDPKARDAIHETAIDVDDEPLRAALMAFGEAMLKG